MHHYESYQVCLIMSVPQPQHHKAETGSGEQYFFITPPLFLYTVASLNPISYLLSFETAVSVTPAPMTHKYRQEEI